MHKKYRNGSKERYEKVRADEKRASAKYRKTDGWRHARKRARQKRRDFIFDILGGVCHECGFADKRALQMDHVDGRGGEKRLGNIDKRYAYVRDFPEQAKKKYQILCANCNFIKREVNHEYFYHGKSIL